MSNQRGRVARVLRALVEPQPWSVVHVVDRDASTPNQADLRRQVRRDLGLPPYRPATEATKIRDPRRDAVVAAEARRDDAMDRSRTARAQCLRAQAELLDAETELARARRGGDRS